jgi:hypothetical protein
MSKIGACGDDCSFCPRYKATISNNDNELQRVKEQWVLYGWRDPAIDAQELKCFGCRKENKCAYQELRDCAFGKNLENCGRCSTYPCERTNAAFAKTEKAFSLMEVTGGKEERDMLIKAFACKKSNLDGIHKNHFIDHPEGES